MMARVTMSFALDSRLRYRLSRAMASRACAKRSLEFHWHNYLLHFFLKIKSVTRQTIAQIMLQILINKTVTPGQTIKTEMLHFFLRIKP